jgi:hypothetical protein
MPKPTPAQVAIQAAEAIRTLNHLTLNQTDLSAPAISSIVQGLAELLDRLPQTFEQLARQLGKRDADGLVRMENGMPARPYVIEVIGSLDSAAKLVAPANYATYGAPAGQLGAAVHNAASLLYNMGAPWTEDDEDD